jgi:retinol dehydrogenase-12
MLRLGLLFRWLAHGIVPEIFSNIRGSASPPTLPPCHPGGPGGVAVVTGATGGIGKEICRGLASRGYHVVLAARDEARAGRLVEELTASGGSASFEPCDLSTAGGAAALVCALVEHSAIAKNGVDLLINNAGIMRGAPADLLGVNAVAPAVLTIGLMQALAESKSSTPRVVNVASSAHLRASTVDRALVMRRADGGGGGGECTRTNLAAYAASKLALLHVSTLLRHALPTAAGLVVHDAHPGLVWTPMIKAVYGRRLAAILEFTRLRWLITRSPAHGAAAVLAAAFAPVVGDRAERTDADAPASGDGAALAPSTQSRSGLEEGTAVADDVEAAARLAASEGTYFVDGVRRPTAQSAESLSVDAARRTWETVLSGAVLPATIAADVTLRSRGVKTAEVRQTLYAYKKGWGRSGDGQLARLGSSSPATLWRAADDKEEGDEEEGEAVDVGESPRGVARGRDVQMSMAAGDEESIECVASRAAAAMSEGKAHVELGFLAGEELESARSDLLSVLAQITSGHGEHSDGDGGFESIQTDLMNLDFRESLASSLPFARLLERLDGLRTALARSTGRPLLAGGGLHLMRYPIGSKFMRHVDEDPALFEPVRNSISFLVYLTPADWAADDGGALHVYERGRAQPRRVLPFGGALVIYDSSLEHEVLPTLRERHLISGRFRETDEDWQRGRAGNE